MAITTRLTTRQLDILCFETESDILYKKEPESKEYETEIAKLVGRYNTRSKRAYDRQIELLQILVERYEQGLVDQIADQHEAEKRRRILIAFLKARRIVDDEPDIEAYERSSKAYKAKESIFRTTNYHNFWPKLHLYRFFILGIFLAAASFSGLPVASLSFVSTYLPRLADFFTGLSNFFVSYDYTAHMIFGLAGSLYCFEAIADTFLMLKHAIKSAYHAEEGHGWKAFKDTFEKAFFKGDRPGRMQNAIVWSIVNGIGFLFTGGWWDSTSFSAGWAMPTWNGTIWAHWTAAVLCIAGLVHDIWNAGRQTTNKVSERIFAQRTGYTIGDYTSGDAELILGKASQIQAQANKIQQKGNETVATLKQFLGGVALFYTSVKLPWAAWTASTAISSSPWLAVAFPWIAPVLGVIGGITFTRAAWCFLKPILPSCSSRAPTPPSSRRNSSLDGFRRDRNPRNPDPPGVDHSPATPQDSTFVVSLMNISVPVVTLPSSNGVSNGHHSHISPRYR